ncbi:MAG TPA: hypothetical protein VGP26_05875 [Actinophytocola sp.]|nr:hypothetical protein [Actinophytocola sp.]
MIGSTLPFGVGALAWSPDGGTVVAGASGRNFDESKTPGIAVLDAASGRLLRHFDKLWTTGLSVSPDGRLLGMLSKESAELMALDTGFRVLDLETGKGLWRIDGLVTEQAFSQDSRLVVTSTFNDLYRMLPTETGQPVTELGVSTAIPRLVPVFSADSRWLVTGDRPGVAVLDGRTGEHLTTLPHPAGPILQVAFRDGDGEIVAVTDNGYVWVIETGTWRTVHETQLEGLEHIALGGMEDLHSPVAFSPDGGRVAVRDGSTVAVYDVLDGRRHFTPLPMPLPARNTSVHFSPDGRHIAANHLVDQQSARGVTVLDAATGETVLADGADKVLVVAFSPDGTSLAAGGMVAGGNFGFVRVYDLGHRPVLCGHSATVTRVAVSSSGARLVVTASADRKAGVFHADSGGRLLEQMHPGPVPAVAVQADGTGFLTGCADGGARLFDTVSGRPRWQVDHDRSVDAVALADGVAATASADKTARVIDLTTGAERSRHAHPGAVTHVALSADGAWVATGCADRATRIFATGADAEPLLYQHDGPVRALSFSGTLLVVAASEFVLVVDAATGQSHAELGHPRQVSAAVLSPDGRLLATGGVEGILRVYDLTATPPTLVAQRGFGAAVTALAMNPLDRRLAVALDDPAVRMVDPDNGAELYRLVHPSPVLDLAFSGDGELIATAGGDAAARVYHAR